MNGKTPILMEKYGNVSENMDFNHITSFVPVISFTSFITNTLFPNISTPLTEQCPPEHLEALSVLIVLPAVAITLYKLYTKRIQKSLAETNI